jgi:hypothetical protein
MIQLELNCPKCANMLCFLLPSDNTFNLLCPYCAAEFGKSTPASGFLYALRNDSMPGLLKIGFTTRLVEERVMELDSSTAAPAPFKAVFYFACSEAQSKEAIAQDALMRHHINKSPEFFRIDEMEALSILRGKLSGKEVFLNVKLHADRYKTVAELQGLDESLREEVLQLRERWSSAEGTSVCISLIYRLMAEHHYSEAKPIADLFLADNPGQSVVLCQLLVINAAIKR